MRKVFVFTSKDRKVFPGFLLYQTKKTLEFKGQDSEFLTGITGFKSGLYLTASQEEKALLPEDFDFPAEMLQHVKERRK